MSSFILFMLIMTMLCIHISDSKCLGGLQSTSEMGLICNEGDEDAIPLTQHNSEGV